MIKCFSFVKMKTRCFLLAILYVAGIYHSFSNSQSVVVHDHIEIHFVNNISTQHSLDPLKRNANDSLEKPEVCQQSITTHISNRYASTAVTTKLKNPNNEVQEYTFSFHIPNYAFVTAFVIEINGQNYTSVVLEKDLANKQFQRSRFVRLAKPSESAQVRDTQTFSLSVNLEPLSMTTLYLTYEELLIKNHGRYEQVVNIFPGQLVDNLRIEIILKETSKIIDLEVPYLRSGHEIENHYKALDPKAYIWEDRHAEEVKFVKVLFIPNLEEQRKFARIMKTDENLGFAGQFVVQYDVENHNMHGEIITSDGYFANFFNPRGLERLIKHVVFVLDTSGSMNGMGKRLHHLKVAMRNMLQQLREHDLMSLVQFNSQIKVWDLESETTVLLTNNKDAKTNFPIPSLATRDNIKKAIDCVDKLTADGGTDILSALKTGLKLVEMGKKFDQIERQPIIMFLTDGEPTVGEKSHQRIKDQVTAFNWGLKKSPISTLAFSHEANQEFLRDLAILNNGSSKHIYEAEDSEFQIEDFFTTISVPVLSNVNMVYNFPGVKNISLTQFPLFYDGSELIVTGKYDNSIAFDQPVIEALSTKGPLKKQDFPIYNSTTDISHLWAFLTTKQLLDKIIIDSGKNSQEYINKILDVCLKYSFVTPFTSMVVVKPNEKIVLGTAELTKKTRS